MTIAERIRKAILERDTQAAIRLSEALRFNFGYKYKDVVDAFVRQGCADAAEYEELIKG